MSDFTMTTGLVSTWVSTVDSRGHARLETRWVDAGAAAPDRVPAPSVAPVAAPAARPLVSHAGHAA